MVFVLDIHGRPAMPTKRHGWVRRELKTGRIKVVSRSPFTIQLNYETPRAQTQEISLGIDAGYKTIGYSAVSNKDELIGGEFKLLEGMRERLNLRSTYRRTRRNRLRYRKPRFFKNTKIDGWLAPSVQHKLDSHIKFVKKIGSILPISNIIVEVANFDIQKIKNPKIKGKDYQSGDQKDFSHVREYILHRDNHKCQNPNCKNKSKSPILQIHHVGFWKKDRSNRPTNLIVLCNNCHTPKNHQKDGVLFGWKPKIKSFREATFMTMVRWEIVKRLESKYTYGCDTKEKRRNVDLEKSHHNDAFVITNGTYQKRAIPTNFEQIKRNNRSLATFYDAKYLDTRDKKIKSGKELFCGRTTRNKNKNSDNLKLYRGHKARKGSTRIRKEHYLYQSGDLVKYVGKIRKSRGIQNKGKYIRLLKISNETKDMVISTTKIVPYLFRRGICETV
jgi:hypothetical protein